ncbi:hypothetical protein PspLS_12060 [Pyricularia sp. CBS 133598]|nr:hypothetical protein PspLS_12060 [Pyricularia sp. CBS 133598]
MYNAFCREGLIGDVRWQDMELLYANLGEGFFYVGGKVPKTVVDYFKKFSFHKGTSVAAMTGIRRKGAPLDEGFSRVAMFRGRYMRDQIGPSGFLTPERVDQIIDLSHSGRFTPFQLIQPLTFALQAETLELPFPLLTFHQVCSPDYLETERQIPFVVGWILVAANGMDNGVSDRQMLETAAGVIDDLAGCEAGSMVSGKILGGIFDMPIKYEEDDA